MEIKWVWEQMTGFRKKYVVYLILSLCPTILQLLNPIITQKIVDEILYKIPEYESNMQSLVEKLIFLLALMVMCTALRTTIWYVSMVEIEKCGQMFLRNVKIKIFSKLQKQDRAFFKANQTGDIITRVTNDVEMGKHGIVTLLRGFLECIVLYVASMIYMLFQNVTLTLSLMVFTPFILVVTYTFAKTARPYYVDLREKLSRLNSNAQENIEGNRVVKAFTREEYEKEKFRKKNDDFRRANLKVNLIWLRFFPVIEGFSQVLPIMVLLLGGYFLMTDRITSGIFLAFNSLCWTLAAPMRTMGILLNDTQRFYACTKKVIELYEAEPEIKNKDQDLVRKDRLEGKIEFENVCVQLEHSDILEHINLKIEPGETVAIMGETGSGKTTLINCISRIIDVTQGRVLLDGIDVRDYDLYTIRKNIGVANQDVFLFSDTIDHNIAFGNTRLTKPQIEDFAQRAKADFVWQLEDGFETLIGERGTGLSGGQKQRLALARALAVKPPILILDDTTSAVDMDTETCIQENLEALNFSCTKIIIAQRVFSTRKADKIVILEKGRIVECGTREELLRKNGYFAEIFMIQNGYDTIKQVWEAEGLVE